MGFKLILAAIAFALTLIIRFVILMPQGVSPDAWYLLALFVGIIADIIGRAMPIDAIAILGIALIALTGVTNEEAADAVKDALSNLNNSLIQITGITIIISRGLLETGLRIRTGYPLIFLFGERTLGAGYNLALADLVIGSVTSSNTARGGAIVHPIICSIVPSFDSDPEKGTKSKTGKYLTLISYHANIITCCVFITATAPNPPVAELVAKATNPEIHLSWDAWFAVVAAPDLIAIPLMPLVLHSLYPSEIKQIPNAIAFTEEKLKEMGVMRHNEKIMLGIFMIPLLLWAGVPEILFGVKVDAATTTFLGLSLCLLTGILTWDDALKEKSVWDTIIWLAALVMMASFFNKLGLAVWLSESPRDDIPCPGLGQEAGCTLLILTYLHAHYASAGGTAHVTAMFGAFHGVGLALDIPSMLFTLIMVSVTGIMTSPIHYISGSSSVIYGSNYVSMTERWKVDFIMSVVEILIFGTTGIIWWKVLGYW